MRTSARWVILLLVGLTLTNCKNSGNDPVIQPANPSTLVSNRLLGTFTQTQLRERISGLGQQIDPFVTLLVQREIQAYRIVYKTKNTDNTDINASGILLVPKPLSGETFPLVSQQHGTIFDESQSPSYFASTSEAGTIGALFASSGYIVSFPDYIGYGESKGVPHPYLHRQTEASASLDMLRAAREFISTNKIGWNNRTMLTGYSQGGHATMSLLKLMEDQFPTEFTLVAASCGAGPYNVEGFMQDLVNTTTHGISQYNNLYVWVLQTYNRVYGLNRPMSFYFKNPYAADVQANGTRSNIRVSINTAFTDAFRTGLNSGSDADFLKAVRDNNVFDWKPKTPLQLYHGNADNQVFYRNSTDALAAMKARAATDVTLFTAQGKDHGPAIEDYLLGTFQFFNSKRQ